MINNTVWITRKEAAKILGISSPQVQHYVKQGRLIDNPPTKKQKLHTVSLAEVQKLKEEREHRAKRINEKRAKRQETDKKYYYTGLDCPHNLRIVVDPTDDSGLLHWYIVSRKTYDDLNTGVRRFEDLGINEILYEHVGQKISEVERNEAH